MILDLQYLSVKNIAQGLFKFFVSIPMYRKGYEFSNLSMQIYKKNLAIMYFISIFFILFTEYI